MPKMVIIHGMTGNAHNWDLVVPAFLGQYHVIVPTVRGRGQSDYSPDGAYNQSDYQADLEALVEHLRLDKFVLVGSSMGGSISMLYAATHPSKIEKLVVVDMGVRSANSVPVQAQGPDRIRDAREEFDSPQDAISWARQFDLYAKVSEDAMRHLVTYCFKPLANGKITWGYDRKLREQRRQARVDFVSQYVDISEKVKNIACPTLILKGSRSDVLTHEMAKNTLDLISDSRLVEIEDSGHVIYLEKPEEFIHEVKMFLGI